MNFELSIAEVFVEDHLITNNSGTKISIQCSFLY